MALKDREIIDGSGLFFFNSSLDESEKLRLVTWFNGLDKEDKDNINLLRHEAAEEAEYFAQDTE